MNAEIPPACRSRFLRFLDLHEKKLLALAVAMFVYEAVSIEVGFVVPARSGELLTGSFVAIVVLSLWLILAQCPTCRSVTNYSANYCPQCGEEMEGSL